MTKLEIVRKTITGAMLAAAGIGALAATSVQAQDMPEDLTVLPPVDTSYDPPKTPWGDPDLRGTWPIDNIASLPMSRPAQFGDRFFLNDEEFAQRQEMANRSDQAYAAEDENDTIGMGHWVESDASGRRTSLLVSPANGQLPALTPEAQALYEQGRSSWTPNTQFNWVTDFDAWDRCVSRGFPASMLPFRYNNGIRVFQAPGYVVIALEMLGTRVIPIDKGEKWPEEVEAWLGESRGHWEGNTLVIETTNIKSGNSATEVAADRNASPLNMATMGVPPFNVIPTSTQAKTVERLTMTGENSIVYELTYEDPEVFTAPWTARLDWTRDDDYGFFEYACHEGNVQVRNYITASRAGELQQDEGEAGDSSGGGH